MQTLFLLWLAVVVIMLSICMAVTLRKRDKMTVYLAQLLGVAISGIVFYALFVASTSETAAYVFNGLYYAATSCMVLQLLGISVLFTHGKPMPRKLMGVLIGITLLDALSCVGNVWAHHMFTLGVFEDAQKGIHVWSVDFRFYEYIHLLWCYIIAWWAALLLIRKGQKSPGFYKAKYFTVAVLYLAVIVFNGLSYAQSKPFDYSVTLYGLFGISMCFFAIWYTPLVITRELRAYTVEITKRGVCFVDGEGECVYANRFAKEFFDIADDRYNGIAEYISAKTQAQKQERMPIHEWTDEKTVDGETRYYKCSCENVLDKKERYVAMFLFIEDRTDEVRYAEKERYEKNHDPLTDLYNRTGFFSAVRERLDAEPDEKYCMVVSNIDGFKVINTLYGTEFGDKILLCQAALIKANSKEGNICGRLDADHYAMLIPKDRFDERIFLHSVDVIKDLFDGKQYQVSYHIGVYELEDVREPAESMYNKAKMTVDEFRGDATQIIVYYQGTYEQKLLRERKIINVFDTALKNGEFIPFYQPQMNRDGELQGAEALVRWNSPKEGMIFPDSFIGVLENANLVYKLDRYIWNCAAAQIKEWRERGIEGLYISVNVSTNDFYHLDVYETLCDVVESNGIDVRDLRVEITETAILSRKEENLAAIDKLRAHGFIVEIDDFGSGYSSLNMLKDIQADALKIDKAFIQDMDLSERNRKILQTIIRMAGDLNMSIVAEGVEVKEMVDELASYGCDCFQGYYYSRPLSTNDFENRYLDTALKDRGMQ